MANPRARAVPAQRIAEVRRFNRFYTRQIGLLRDGLLGTVFSLTEGRVLQELAGRGHATAGEIAASLGIDPGYLSRMLRRFVAARLVVRTASRRDRRQGILRLTAKGRATFAALDRRSRREVGALLAPLGTDDQHRLLAAMATIEKLLGNGAGGPRGGAAKAARRVTLRPHRPGDMGWIVARHGAVYAAEYDWGAPFEALVAEVVTDFLRRHDAAREAAWIAEIGGVPAGSVMLVDDGGGVARLRMLLVEPHARGLGVGRRLVDCCIAFARAKRYRKITLWTHTVLTAARAIYASSGFRLVETKPHRDFGVEVVGETWDLELQGSSP
jgi:DNA-binding MarR family transcriptional regulator/GNAT superfamily N-acetyltransferase